MGVLVAYATSRGSTRGIAERLADRLQQHGTPATAASVTDAVDVAGYEAVLLGSAVHGGKWLPEATRFAYAHADELRQCPLWLFSVSTVGDAESMFPPRVANRMRAMRREPDEIAALRVALRVREHRNFAGAVSPSDWPRAGRAFFRATGGRYGDCRNWPAIDAWADGIAAELDEERAAPRHTAGRAAR